MSSNFDISDWRNALKAGDSVLFVRRRRGQILKWWECKVWEDASQRKGKTLRLCRGDTNLENIMPMTILPQLIAARQRAADERERAFQIETDVWVWDKYNLPALLETMARNRGCAQW